MKELAVPLDVLVIAVHPDDAEISVGGTILQARDEGLQVGILDLTSGEPTPHGTEEIRRRETTAATAILQPHWRHNLGLPNRSLMPSLENRAAIAGVLRLTRPRLLLAPYWDDNHPDHVAASQLVDAARFWSKLTRSDLPGRPHHPEAIFYYWSIHLRIHPKPAFVLDISPWIEQKMQALRCYESQVIQGRSTEHPTLLDDIRDRARYWGWTIGTAYAEPFASREEIGVSSLQAVLRSSRPRPH